MVGAPGAVSATEIANDVEEVPVEFVAVMVTVREARVVVGVPEIKPDEVLKLIPAAVNAEESADGIESELAAPPEFVMA